MIRARGLADIERLKKGIDKKSVFICDKKPNQGLELLEASMMPLISDASFFLASSDISRAKLPLLGVHGRIRFSHIS